MITQVAALREVTQQELIDFFNKHIKVGAPHRKSLRVQVYGALHNAEFQAAKCNTDQPQSVYINDIFSFRRSQPLYRSFRGGFGHMNYECFTLSSHHTRKNKGVADSKPCAIGCNTSKGCAENPALNCFME